MGATGSSDRLTIDEKLQYLETKLQKQCTYHRRDATMFCSIPNCDKCPYLCESCQREKIHQHEEGIHNHNEFLKALITLIDLKIKDESQNNQAANASLEDLPFTLKETTKIMEHINLLEREFLTIVAEFRQKVQTNLDRIFKKSQNGEQKISSFLNFYRNPNVLVCKLSTEQSDRFLLEFKSQLKQTKRKGEILNEDEQLTELKIELGNMKGKLRGLLNITNITHFTKKNSLTTPSLNVNFKKTLLISQDSVTQIIPSAFSVYLNTSKENFGLDINTKEARKMFSTPINLMCSRKKGDEFIGMINSNKLIVYDGRMLKEVGVSSKVSGLDFIKGKRKMYGIIGEESGILDFIDFEQNKSAFHYRCGDEPICFIQVSESNSLICCAGKKTLISVFRFKNKFSTFEEVEELEFEYIAQMGTNIIPQGDLQLMRIQGNELYLFGPSRNFSVYDLLLNTEILQTENNQICSPFIEAQFATINGCDYLITLNQGEESATLWYIDKIKRSTKSEEIVKEKNQRPIISIGCVRNELWLLRDGVKNIDIFSLGD